jgi:hypothetical protein
VSLLSLLPYRMIQARGLCLQPLSLFFAFDSALRSGTILLASGLQLDRVYGNVWLFRSPLSSSAFLLHPCLATANF